MIILSDIIKYLNSLFPEKLKEEWDNVGLMTGEESSEINKVLLCLDVTSDVAEEAKQMGADLIISHHPLIFSPLKNITSENSTSRIVMHLIKNNICAYSMHTNFDIADGGMNDILSEKLGLVDIRKFTDAELLGEEGKTLSSLGRVGHLDIPMTLSDFSAFVKATLSSRALKILGDGEDIVQTVAVCSGSGKSMMTAAFNSGADVFVSSDFGHHDAQEAFEMGLNLIDAGHFETENIIVDFLYDLLSEEYPELIIKKSEQKPYFKSI